MEKIKDYHYASRLTMWRGLEGMDGVVVRVAGRGVIG